jgi:hypothetical protein
MNNNVLPARFCLHVEVSLSERGRRPKSFPARDHSVGVKAPPVPPLQFVCSPLEHRLKIDFRNRFSYHTIQIIEDFATTDSISAFKITQKGCHYRLNDNDYIPSKQKNMHSGFCNVKTIMCYLQLFSVKM